MQDAVEKSEYEQLREANIARNKAVMKALGLDDSDFQLHALHKSSGGSNKSSSSSSSSSSAPKRKRPEKGAEPSRRSSRVAGQEAESAGLEKNGLDGEDGSGGGSKRWQADLHATEEEHAAAEAAHVKRWAGKQGKVTIVGTASYGHTLMRVRTMSEAGLGKRVKAIERAAGKHAVVKMRLFAQVLCLEGYDDLASDAADALARLIDLLGDPEEENGEEEEAAEGENGEGGEGGGGQA